MNKKIRNILKNSGVTHYSHYEEKTDSDGNIKISLFVYFGFKKSTFSRKGIFEELLNIELQHLSSLFEKENIDVIIEPQLLSGKEFDFSYKDIDNDSDDTLRVKVKDLPYSTSLPQVFIYSADLHITINKDSVLKEDLIQDKEWIKQAEEELKDKNVYFIIENNKNVFTPHYFSSFKGGAISRVRFENQLARYEKFRVEEIPFNKLDKDKIIWYENSKTLGYRGKYTDLQSLLEEDISIEEDLLMEDNKDTIYYHGTQEKFDNFKSPINWFTTNYGYAEEFALSLGSKHYMYEVNLDIKNVLHCGDTDTRVYGLLPVQPYKFTRSAINIMINLGVKEEEFRKLVSEIAEDYDHKFDGYDVKLHTITRSPQFAKLCLDKGFKVLKTIEQGNDCYGVLDKSLIKVVNVKEIDNDGEEIKYSK